VISPNASDTLTTVGEGKENILRSCPKCGRVEWSRFGILSFLPETELCLDYKLFAVGSAIAVIFQQFDMPVRSLH
jgi:hypothetical protein